MKCEKIVLMIPTYKRVTGLQRLLDSCMRLATDARRLRFSLCVNENDIATQMYLANKYWPFEGGFEVVKECTEQPNLALYFNMLYKESRWKSPDTIVSMIGDDMLFGTKDWDTILLNTMNENNGEAIVYFNDNYIAHDKCMVNMFTTRHVVDHTKKPFMCPIFHAEMIDVVWTMVGQYTGLSRYHGNVLLHHMHGSHPNVKQDETFKRLQPLRNMISGDQADKNNKICRAYATIAASNLIESGIGKWNLL